MLSAPSGFTPELVTIRASRGRPGHGLLLGGVATAAVAALTLSAIAAPSAVAAPGVTIEERTFGPSGVLSVSDERIHTRVTRRGATTSDFDGDGVDDLAVTAWSLYGVLGAPLSDRSGKGTVAVRYSSVQRDDTFTGLASARLTSFSSSFGGALTSGDFNGDGYDDLVIADHGDSSDGTDRMRQAGAVWVFPGSSTGLHLSTARRINRSSGGIPGNPAALERFGAAVAAGDLDGDGFDDLAIGAPGTRAGGAAAGGVVVVHGTRWGLSRTRAIAFSAATSGVPGEPGSGAAFGAALAVGRVTGDRVADLVVTAPGVGSAGDSDGLNGSGRIYLLRGSSRGVSFSGVTKVDGREIALAAHAEGTTARGVDLRSVGGSVALGDIDGDNRAEVVVGAPAGHGVGGKGSSGAAAILRGRDSGLSVAGARVIDVRTAGLTPGTDDRFGASIAVGDLDRNNRADVLVGIPGRRVDGRARAGAVLLLPGSWTGVRGADARVLSQQGSSTPGAPGTGDEFGTTVAIMQADGRSGLDVLVGAPFDVAEGDSSTWPSGSVTIYTSQSSGIRAWKRWGGREFAVPRVMTGLGAFGTTVLGEG